MINQGRYSGPLINVDSDDVLNSLEAARILEVSDREIRAKIARGTLPAIKIFGKYKINRKAVRLYRHFYILKRRSRKQVCTTLSSKDREVSLNQSPNEITCNFKEIENSQPYNMLFRKKISVKW